MPACTAVRCQTSGKGDLSDQIPMVESYGWNEVSDFISVADPLLNNSVMGI